MGKKQQLLVACILGGSLGGCTSAAIMEMISIPTGTTFGIITDSTNGTSLNLTPRRTIRSELPWVYSAIFIGSTLSGVVLGAALWSRPIARWPITGLVIGMTVGALADLICWGQAMRKFHGDTFVMEFHDASTLVVILAGGVMGLVLGSVLVGAEKIAKLYKGRRITS